MDRLGSRAKFRRAPIGGEDSNPPLMQNKSTQKNAFFMPSSLKVPKKINFLNTPRKVKPDFAVSEVAVSN